MLQGTQKAKVKYEEEKQADIQAQQQLDDQKSSAASAVRGGASRACM